VRPRQSGWLLHVNEHADIDRALFGASALAVPAKCTKVFVSPVNSTWATDTDTDKPGCVDTPAGGNGTTILHVERNRWRPVTAGSYFRLSVDDRR